MSIYIGTMHILDLPWHNHNNNNSINNCNNNRKRRVSFLVRLRNASPMQISLPLLVPPRARVLQCTAMCEPISMRNSCSRKYIYTYICVYSVCDWTVITYSWAGNMQRHESFGASAKTKLILFGCPSLFALLKGEDALAL